MSRHVTDRLAPYWEGVLAPPEAREIEGHLAGCVSCAAASTEVRAGVLAARRLAPEPMPEAVARRIRAAAESKPSRSPRRLAVLATAAAIAAAVAGGVLVWVRSRPHVQLEAASGPPAAFERLAREAHRRAFAQGEPLELVTSDGGTLRQWAVARAGVSPPIATRRPAGEGHRYDLLGARTVRGEGYTAAAIAFRVDEKPVTLLVAPADRVPEAPEWGALGKRVRWQIDPETGAKLLSWTNSGQAYTLVSELPGGGQQACLVCHTDAKRQALIASLDAKLAPR
jgi:anti-sigma factor RsiW